MIYTLNTLKTIGHKLFLQLPSTCLCFCQNAVNALRNYGCIKLWKMCSAFAKLRVGATFYGCRGIAVLCRSELCDKNASVNSRRTNRWGKCHRETTETRTPTWQPTGTWTRRGRRWIHPGKLLDLKNSYLSGAWFMTPLQSITIYNTLITYTNTKYQYQKQIF